AKAQAAALAKMKSGARGSSVDAAARTLIDRTKYKGRFIHGLGHSVGLAVHDPSTGLSPGSDLVLRPNMVLTDEPGIYVPGFGGVRIEGAEGVPQHGPHRLRPVAFRPVRRFSDDDPHLRLPMRPVDLVQADVPDMDLIDLDREDLLVAPPLVVAEPSLLFRQRHGRIPA